jgi:hypothetical protein
MDEDIAAYLAASEDAAFARILAIQQRIKDLEIDLKNAQAEHKEAMRIKIMWEASAPQPLP